MSDRLLRSALDGAVAGAMATAAMSVPMLLADWAGLMPKPPPESITEDALSAAGVRPEDRTERQENVVATLTHLGFGTTCGALYGVVRRRLPAASPVPPPVAGVAYGLGIWAVSYKGWVPALGILPPPERDRPGRVRTMIAAHVVYGAVLAAVEARLAGRRGAGGRA